MAYPAAVLASPGLVADWPLDETSGTTFTDDKGTHPGALTGVSNTLGVAAPFPTMGTAVAFTGNDSRIVAANTSAVIAGGALTLAVWANLTSANSPYGYGHIAGFRNDTTCDLYALQLTGTNNLEVRFRPSDASENTCTINGVTVGAWHHLALVANPSAGTLVAYLDGAQVATKPLLSASTVAATTEPFTLGALSGGANTFNGTVDHASLWNRALSAAEVAALYNAASSTTAALAGTAPGSAGLSGTLTARAALAGTAPGGGTTSAALTTLTALNGSAAGGAGTSGTLGGSRVLSGTAAGSAGASAALTGGVAPLAGTAPGSAAASGTLTAWNALAGTAPGSAGATGALTVAGPSGTAPGVGTTTGTLTVAAALAGTAPGSAGLAGALAAQGALGGMTTGTASLSGTLAQAVALAGMAPGTAGVSGTLAVPGAPGHAIGVAGLTGALLAQAALAGTTIGTAGTSGVLVTLVGVIMHTLGGPSGDILVVGDSSLATYTAQGYAEIAAPYVSVASHNPAWNVGPTYRIAHADGRQYATTAANYVQYYQPLGFTLGVPERAASAAASGGGVAASGGGVGLYGVGLYGSGTYGGT